MKLAVKETLARLREGLGRFAPFNLAALAVAALAVLANHDALSDTTCLNLARGLYWGALAGMVCRLDGERRDSAWRKVAAGPVTVLVGALGCWFWFATVEDSPRYWPWLMVYSGTFIALASASVALLYRVADEKTLVSRLVASAIIVCGAAMIFIGSIELCVFAFDKLVASVSPSLYGDVFYALYLSLVPVGIASLLPSRKTPGEDANRAAAFLFWLLLPASLILLAILYLYLGRIALTLTMPSGELNWFGSIALATYVFFYLALRDSTRPFFRRFVRWGWALLIPVQAAQIVGIVIRYNAYGLSDLRFAGMITLAIGLFALVLAAFDRCPRVLFAVIAVVGLVFTVTPLNIKDVPIRNQESRLFSVFARYGIDLEGDLKPSRAISDEDADRICGSWRYLESVKSVYYRMERVKRLREKLGKDSLFTRLGIDQSKLRQNSSWARDYSSRHQSAVTIRFKGNDSFPLGGYGHLQYVSWTEIIRTGDRYYLRLKMGDAGRFESYDVTEHVTRLFRDTKWDGVIPKASADFEVPAIDAFWELQPALAFAVLSPKITIWGEIGKTFDTISLCNSLILTP